MVHRFHHVHYRVYLAVDVNCQVYPVLADHVQALKRFRFHSKNCLNNFKNYVFIPGLNGCLEDAFLLRFLRARKHDMQKALALYMNYYAVRLQYPDVFKNLKPSLVFHVFSNGIVSMLPEATKEGHRILLFRPALWQPDDWPSADLLRANVIVVEDLLQNYHETQVHGLVVLVSLSGFGWKHACQLSNLDFARRVARLLQDTTPVRVKAVHLVNEPVMFSRVFALLQPLLKPKQQRRIIFHGNSLKSLHAYLPPHLLPCNIGLEGTGPPAPSPVSSAQSRCCFRVYFKML
ncbi:unnamed protein product [Dibothriocephalus latus]|uniref:CRAL-TRIO domain-containing protein n=1 Tax=Dibothriocephalus latus TaxID=60516 RepID=A0A3P6U497_DIBLA|nr:unnamed protein product [Dibothriocephalus latus]